MRERRAWWKMLTLALSAATAVVVSVEGLRGQDDAAPRSAIYLEDSPAAQELVEEAARLRRDNRLPDAVGVYQRIIDEYPQKLMTRDDEHYYDTVRWVHQELSSDPNLAATYRRMYEATAQRELSLAEAAADEIAALEGVVQRYLLCEAGLEAGLRLASLYLGEGNVVDAGAVLAQISHHPQLGPQRGRYHLLQAAVALFGDYVDRYQMHRKALEDMGERERLAQLDRWRNNLRRPPSLSSDRVDLPDAVIPQTLGKALWTHAAPPLLFNEGEGMGSGRGGMMYNARSLPMVPVMDGSVLYLNTTGELTAMDRISRRVIWRHTWTGNIHPNLRNRGNGDHSEIRSVELSDGMVYGVLGPASDQLAQFRQNLDTSLLCVDQHSGEIVWQVKPGDVDDSLQQGFFHGTPIAGPGRIYAQVRRSQTGFFESFIVALDARTGRLLWRRHLASAAIGRGITNMPFARMSANRGQLFVVDHMGTVAALDGRTGAINWLTLVGDRAATMDARVTMQMNRSNAETVPLLVDAGLIVTSRNVAQVMLLDPATGAKIRDLGDPAFARAALLVPCEGDVLAVGRTVHRLDGRTLESKWEATLEGVTSNSLVGLPAITQGAIWISTGDRLTVLDSADGRELFKEKIAATGNVVAQGPQLLIASGDAIHNFMEWSVAHKSLREQATQEVADPRPGMALAELALATNHPESVVEGLDFTLEAMRRRAESRNEPLAGDTMQEAIFTQMRSMIDPTRTPDPVLREQIFERLAMMTVGPADEVLYLLSLGAFMVETDRPVQAVEYYQTILKTPALASQVYDEGFMPQPAGQEARHRLERIVVDAPFAYVKFEAEASQKLAALTAAPRPDVDALIDLARQYPLAQAASQALMAAAESHVKAGERGMAVGLMRRAYLQHRSQADAEAIVGRLVQVLVESGQSRQAMQWLRKGRRDYPQLRPIRDGAPVEVETWLGQLMQTPETNAHLPTLALPLQKPKVLPGSLLVASGQEPRTQPRDAIVTHRGNRIQYRRGPELDVQWEHDAARDNVRLLSHTDDRVLLWYPKELRLVSLEAATGAEAWPAIDLAAAMEQVVVPEPTQQEVNRAGRNADGGVVIRRRIVIDGVVHDVRERIEAPVQIRGGRIADQGFVQARGVDTATRRQQVSAARIAANETVIVACDALQRIVAIDRLTGQVLWFMYCPFPIRAMDLGEDFVAFAGGDNQQNNARGSLIVLDAMTGELRHGAIELPVPPNWLGLSPAGTVVVAVADALVGFDVQNGSELWRQEVARVDHGHIDADRVFVVAGNSIHMFDVATGQRLANFAAKDLRPGLAPVWQHAAGFYHILTNEQVLSATAEGDVAWRDAIFDDPKNLHAQFVSDQYVVAIGWDATPVVAIENDNGRQRFQANPDRRNTYRVYVFDRENGLLARQQTLGPVPESVDPDACIMLDDRIVLGTRDHIIIVPGDRKGRP